MFVDRKANKIIRVPVHGHEVETYSFGAGPARLASKRVRHVRAGRGPR